MEEPHGIKIGRETTSPVFEARRPDHEADRHEGCEMDPSAMMSMMGGGNREPKAMEAGQ
jgi:hypothetical protein